MKNSQVAVLCARDLAGPDRRGNQRVAGAVASARRAARRPAVASAGQAAGDRDDAQGQGRPLFYQLPQGRRRGGEGAGRRADLGRSDRPDPAKQNEVIDTWITRGVDVIAVAVENQAGISTVLRKARERGIKVLTWDADAEPDARDFFVNQATPEGIGYTLTDEAARMLGGKGEFAIITGSLTAANRTCGSSSSEAGAEKYPEMKLATIRPCDDDRDKAFAETQTDPEGLSEREADHGDLRAGGAGRGGGGEAGRPQGREGDRAVAAQLCKRYVHDGVVQAVVLWNTKDLGYLTVYAAALLAEGKMPARATRSRPGGWGRSRCAGRRSFWASR